MSVASAGDSVAVVTIDRLRARWRDLVPFGRRHRRFVLRGLASTLAFIAVRLVFPVPLKAIVDRSAAPANDLPALPALVPDWGDPVVWLALGFVALSLLAGLAEHIQRLNFARFSSRTINDVRVVAMTRITATEGDGLAPGDVVARIVSDTYRVKQGLKGVLNNIVRNGLLAVSTCGALAFIDLRMGAVQLVGSAAVVGLGILGKRRVARAAALHREDEGLLADAVHRALAGLDDEDDDDVVVELDSESGQADIETTRWEGLTTFAGHVVLAVTAGLVLAAGVQAFDAGELSSGTLFVVVAYLLSVQGPMIRVARQVVRLGPIVASANRLAVLANARKGSD